MLWLSSCPLYAFVLITYSGLAAADVQTYCPAKGVCYSVGIPPESATSGTGDIYLQISGPSSYPWIALGTGTKMAGSNMFIMYPDGNGNVTLSARRGLDHDEPQQDTSNTAARLTLLEGSGVDADVMRANIVCANCEQWANGGTMNLNSTTPWIAAWRTSGSSPQTTDANADIDQHDDTSQWKFDLTKAILTGDSNPFIGLDTNATATSSSGVISGDDSEQLDHAHAVIMGLAFFGLYPVGALLIPLVGNWKVHATFQVSVLALTWVGFGLGYALSGKTQDHFSNYHTVLGTTLVCLMMLQPIFGILHHRHYLKYKTRGFFSYFHIYYGYTLILISLVEGGLGIRLAGSSGGHVAAYVVIVAIICVLYFFIRRYIVTWRQRGGKVGRRWNNNRDDALEMQS